MSLVSMITKMIVPWNFEVRGRRWDRNGKDDTGEVLLMSNEQNGQTSIDHHLHYAPSDDVLVLDKISILSWISLALTTISRNTVKPKKMEYGITKKYRTTRIHSTWTYIRQKRVPTQHMTVIYTWNIGEEEPIQRCSSKRNNQLHIHYLKLTHAIYTVRFIALINKPVCTQSKAVYIQTSLYTK